MSHVRLGRYSGKILTRAETDDGPRVAARTPARVNEGLVYYWNRMTSAESMMRGRKVFIRQDSYQFSES